MERGGFAVGPSTRGERKRSHHTVARSTSTFESLGESLMCHGASFLPNREEPGRIQHPDQLPGVTGNSGQRERLSEHPARRRQLIQLQ